MLLLPFLVRSQANPEEAVKVHEYYLSEARLAIVFKIEACRDFDPLEVPERRCPNVEAPNFETEAEMVFQIHLLAPLSGKYDFLFEISDSQGTVVKRNRQKTPGGFRIVVPVKFLPESPDSYLLRVYQLIDEQKVPIGSTRLQIL